MSEVRSTLTADFSRAVKIKSTLSDILFQIQAITARFNRLALQLKLNWM